VAGRDDDVPLLAAVVERQRLEIARLRAEAAADSVVAMAKGTLMERDGCAATEAARQLADMAAAAGLPLPEMAGAVLGAEPARLAPAADLATMAAAGRPGDAAELTGVLAGHVRARFGAVAVAAWLLEPDGALELIGADGLGGTESSRWRRIPPQLDCAERRVADGAGDLWWEAGDPAAMLLPAPEPRGDGPVARAVLALRDRTGVVLGVLETWWPGASARFDPVTTADLPAVAAGFAEVLGARLAHAPLGSPAPPPAMFAMLDEVAGSVLVARPVMDAGAGAGDAAGKVTDFTIVHLSPGYADPAGRPAAELAGLSLLAAYPASVAEDGLFARAVRVLASGAAEHVPGAVTASLAGDGDGIDIADLRVAPCFDGVAFTWRVNDAPDRLVEVLRHAHRLGQMGAWEENLVTGAVRWTDNAFAVFGLDERQAAPIPTAQLHSYVIAADRALVRRFRESLLRNQEPRTVMFRIVRPGDTVLRQIRIYAEPVVAGTDVVAVRGAFQDVSAHYHTQVALAATRDQLADSEQRAAEEHLLALRLQRAIMPEDAPPVQATGVDVAVRYRPAEPGHLVAGDWYDALLLPGKDLLLVVGDITGHGIDAVTGMVAARNALRGLAATEEGPAELLRHLNYASCHLSEGIAGTVVCGRYDPDTRVLRWARAGHLPPVLVRDGVADTLPLPAGVLLGLDPEAEYEEAELQLRSGDTLLLFTDGLIESRTDSISDALSALVTAAVPAGPDASSHADRILASAVSDTGDDACLVAVRIP
jgi:Stage II sporulation protein E (SpoIIE)/ANTAR domain